MSIKLHALGKNGPLVPALGFGLMGLSFKGYGKSNSDEENFAILDRALELGYTFWDTADMYGDNEEVVGKWFKRTGKRDQIFLATKFGFVKNSPTYEVDSTGEYCKKACDESLRLLGVDYIDLFYVHSANPATPIEQTMRAMAELKAEGKIKHIGLSMVSSATLRRAVKIANVAAVQTEYSVFNRYVEGPDGTDLLATCRELGVALVVCCPLGRGVLTSTFSNADSVSDSTDIRPHMFPRFQEANRAHNTAIVNKFKAFADKKGCSVSQLALAWLLKQGEDIFPIPGTKKVKYLEENWKSIELTLTDEEEVEIRQFGDVHQLSGSTQPAGFESYIFRDTKEE